MEQLGGLFLRVLTVSAGCSAVVGPLLLLAPRMRKRVAARSFYVLFLLLALRLMLPFAVKLPAPAVRVQVPATVTVPVPAAVRPAPTAAVQAPAAGQAVHAPVSRPQVSPAAPKSRSVPLLHIAGGVWAAGAAVCVLWAAGSFLPARRRLLNAARPAGEGERAALERLRSELGVRRPVRLCRSGNTATPLALGLLRPAVVLPDGGCTGAELELVLRHELTHIRRWDVAYKLVLSLACAVNWFNPLVWLMDRAAGRNLELCCDDDVARGLSEAERKEYGRVLLAAAGAGRPLPFTTCFSGGKEQMTTRLLNLFTKKKNSAALVCLVLAAALLAGGLVACEQAGASVPAGDPVTPAPALTPENEANRALLKDYFYANYQEDNASVALADLTGDGLDELLVLTMDPDTKDPPSLREELTRFTYGCIECFGVGDGGVFQYPATLEVSSSHVGWGYVYLVPRTDGNGGYALLDFRPYFGQGMGSYAYNLYAADEADGFTALEGDEVMFFVGESMGLAAQSDTAPEAVQELLERIQGYRDSGAALLVYNEGYAGSTGGPELAYLNVPPADAFAAGTATDLAALRAGVVTGGQPVRFPLPSGEPAAPTTPPQDVAAAYLEAIAQMMYCPADECWLDLTGLADLVASTDPSLVHMFPTLNFPACDPGEEFTLYEGSTLTWQEIADRMAYKEEGAAALKYRWRLQYGGFEDVAVSCTVERVQTRGDSALVEITEELQFRRRDQAEPSRSTVRYLVDLVLIDREWMVADVNHRGHALEWCDAWNEEDFCAVTGLPHSTRWFNVWLDSPAGREELGELTPCQCMGGRTLESGDVALVFRMMDGTATLITVRLLPDDGVEILSAEPWEV